MGFANGCGGHCRAHSDAKRFPTMHSSMHSVYLRKFGIATATSAALACAGNTAWAATTENYPNRPIRLIVAFSAGGGSDTSARIVAAKLGEQLSQQVVVDNRPGAGGNIATELAVRAQPDGYTLLWGFSAPLVVNPSLYKNLPFDTEKDLEPIALIAASQYMLVIHPSIPATSMKDLLAYIRARPAQISYASAGIGTPHHLATELFKSRTGLDIAHVIYKGGAPAAVAVMSGEVQMHFGSFSSSLPFVKARRLNALAVTGPARSPEAPEVATMQELGFAGFDVRSWFAVLAPAHTSRAIIMQLNRELLKVITIAYVQARLRKTGVDATGSTPQELALHIKTEKATWAKVISDAAIKPE